MPISCCNLLMGTMYVELEEGCEGFNKTTGDKMELKFTTNSWGK